jgi:hypothetical protein
VNLCLDSVQVINRIPKDGEEKSPYEKLGGACNSEKDTEQEICL